MKNLIPELNTLQSKTIGLFVNQHALADKSFELVINDDDGLLHTIQLGNLGGMTEIHIPKEKGIYKKFPDGLNLFEFKKNPFALSEFTKNFFK